MTRTRTFLKLLKLYRSLNYSRCRSLRLAWGMSRYA